MEKLCYECKQEECPRCKEKARERNAWFGNLGLGVILLCYTARIAYIIGVTNGRQENINEENENINEEEDSNEQEES